jgi:hypothetical protein
MLAEWRDEDFGYDREYDLFGDRRDIQRHDGAILYCVSELKWGARYTVHLCAKAREIWAIETKGLRGHIWEDEGWKVCYSPRGRNKGQPSARGYVIPCYRASEFGKCFVMPDPICRRLLSAKTKEEAGNIAELAFAHLVDAKFFPAIFLPPARKSGVQDDICGGIDFWVGEDIPVQVKFDGPGGREGTGNLFFQTHTLPVRECKRWHEFEY